MGTSGGLYFRSPVEFAKVYYTFWNAVSGVLIFWRWRKYGCILSPLFKVRFINLVRDAASSTGASAVAGSASESGLVCSIAGFNYSPDIDAGFLHAGAGEVYPQTIKLTADLIVMHTHGLGYGQDGSRRQANFPYGMTTGGGSTDSTGTSAGGPPEISTAAGDAITGGGD